MIYYYKLKNIYCKIDADIFEGLLYTILSEEPYNNQRIHQKEENDDYTISDYVSQNFGMLIGETMTCLFYTARWH